MYISLSLYIYIYITHKKHKNNKFYICMYNIYIYIYIYLYIDKYEIIMKTYICNRYMKRKHEHVNGKLGTRSN